MFKLFVLALASWRLTHMIMEERGPGAVLNKVRARWFDFEYIGEEEVSRPAYSMLNCAYCTSFWTSLAVLALPQPFRVALAVNSVAIFIDKAHNITAVTEEADMTVVERDAYNG